MESGAIEEPAGNIRVAPLAPAPSNDHPEMSTDSPEAFVSSTHSSERLRSDPAQFISEMNTGGGPAKASGGKKSVKKTVAGAKNQGLRMRIALCV